MAVYDDDLVDIGRQSGQNVRKVTGLVQCRDDH
jgi:hypothetical protein